MNKNIRRIIGNFLKAKDEYEYLKNISCGQKLDDAREEYEYAEAVLRAYSEEK